MFQRGITRELSDVNEQLRNSNKKDLIEKAAILTPIALAFISFCGFLYANTYYSAFGIRIVRYMEVSEMLLYFLNKAIQLFFYILFVSSAYFIYWFIKREHKKENRDNVMRFWVISCPVISIASIILSLNYGIHSSQTFYNICLYFFIGMLCVCYFVLIFESIVWDNNSIKVQIMCGTLVLVASSFYFADDDINDIAINKSDTVIQMENKIISCDSNYCYIGKTNNYIFFYSKTGDSTEILPVSSIKKITFKKVK